MAFRSLLNSLWEEIISPFILGEVTATPSPPPPPSASSDILVSPLGDMDMDMGFGAPSGEFSSVDGPCVSNISPAVSMSDACYPDPSVLSTSSVGCPGYGFCASSISTSPPSSGVEVEVEFDGSSWFAGDSTLGGFSTFASSPSPPYGFDGTAKPTIGSRRSPTSLPRCVGFARFTPSTHANYSGSEFSTRALPGEPAIPGGYPTPPWIGYSGVDYFAPSPDSGYSPPPPSSTPSPPSPSRFPTNPATWAGLSTGQVNNNLQSFSEGDPILDYIGVNMAEFPSGNRVPCGLVQNKALKKHISKLHRRLLFLKTKELRQGLSDELMWYTAVTERLLDSELRSEEVTVENDPVPYASKRALELEADVEVGAAKGSTGTEQSHIPARKKARPEGKGSDPKTIAEGTAYTRGKTKIPFPMRSRTYSARRAARAELPASPPPRPYTNPIAPVTPVKLESPNSGGPGSPPRISLCGKRSQEDDVATGPTTKKSKVDRVSQHKKMSKSKLRKVVNCSKRHRRSKAAFAPPIKSSNPSTCAEELVDRYEADPICRKRLAKGSSEAASAKATPPRKRTSENIIVKSPITKRPRKEYFSEGMVFEYESDDDTETVDKKPDKMEAQPTTPTGRYTFSVKSTTFKSPLSSILGKRTSTTTTQSWDTRVNKKGRKEYFQEGMILEYDSDDEEPMTSNNDHASGSTGEVDYHHASYYSPASSFCAQAMFSARVEDVMEEDEIL